jgi:hypothetical protein
MAMENFIELPLKDQLLKKVESYMKSIWLNKVDKNKLNDWLNNFENVTVDIDEKERLNMLFLLSKFSFLGDNEIRSLLKSLFRDLFKRPIIHKIRKDLGDTLNLKDIYEKFNEEYERTRFVAIGGVSESGAMLMYPFRQENDIPEKYIISQTQILKENGADKREIAEPSIKRYIFIDDFIGTGSQGKDKLKNDVNNLKSLNKDLEICYYVLVATEEGLDAINKLNLFTSIEAVFILDDTFKVFEEGSRYYKTNHNGIDREFAKNTAYKYGQTLFRTQELGFGDCQLLFGFAHNTPDNTVPVFWGAENGWKYIFKRFIKKA